MQSDAWVVALLGILAVAGAIAVLNLAVARRLKKMSPEQRKRSDEAIRKEWFW